MVKGSYRPFAEYETEAWVPQYLATILENTIEIIALSTESFTFPGAY